MFYKIGFFVLIGIALFLGGMYTADLLNRTPAPVQPTPTVSQEQLVTPTSLPLPTKTQTNDEEAIKKAMADKHGKATSEVNIRVSQNTGTHAWGSVSFGGEMGGGWFLAYKETNGWMIVDDGNGTISCEVIAPYNFPVSMVPECVDKNGNLIKR